MKRYILSALVFAGIALASCNDNQSEQYGQGVLDLSTITATVEESTRATSTDNFCVNITDAAGQNVGSWTIATLPEQVMLREGAYTINVASHEQFAEVSRECYFVGSQEVEIIPGETTTADVIDCYSQSLKVSVEFEGEILEAMADDCQTTLSLGEASISVAGNDNEPVYFRPFDTNNTIHVEFTGTVDGAAERFVTDIVGVKVGQWRKLVITMTYVDGERVFSASIARWQEDEDIYVEQ